MKYVITGRNLEVSDELRSYVEKKFGKLDNYFSDDTEIHVTLSQQREDAKVEVTIPMRGTTIRAEETSSDMYASIDLLKDVVEGQLRKNRKKLIDRKQNKPSFSSYFMENLEDEEPQEESIKTMDTAEACFQIDMSGHSFYVFWNADTDQVNVVYKRKDGNYGLIEPEYE